MKIISTLVGIVIITLMIWGGGTFYDNIVRDELADDLTQETITKEGEAIEISTQIIKTHSALDDNAIHDSLQSAGDFRTEDSSDSEQAKRVQNLPDHTSIKKGYKSNAAPSRPAQQAIPITLPYQPCTLEYGFDESDYVTVFEVCDDGR